MSMDIEKWAERIYLEEDFGKNIATSTSGVVGLIIYLSKSDFALAAFVAIIIFPVVKIISNSLREKYIAKKQERDYEAAKEELDRTVKELTDQERLVIHKFVQYKSAVMSNKYIKLNNVFLPDGAVKSLMERKFITEEFYGLSGEYDLKLNLDVFEAGRRYFEK
jgi:ABC-type multidrug transport system fused ATPase/permease subunit